ncbi:tetratricopeptide repeat protein [Candidatus Magnetominusculus xianensis]|uniref:Tetratricopeptide repeat protein n=1 Tax=Candidatus Magnetominusculus xianensis TaxID=1748249 RepID=A0ABR5SG53_9BACT|nr:tetratricopeptide repeat protein [Candidatus Magnetominusculus xianensis]KWT87422.1 hypothetical protein ASN18_1341 [Candidatus Magnetominusculus xianensis]MBF0403681.1 tetratricopeptide repeat protein [Nitrospirota bacterium]
MHQGDLFDELQMRKNQIARHIISLNFTAAQNDIDNLLKTYPLADLGDEDKVCKFFMERLTAPDIINIVSAWMDFTETFKGNIIAANKDLKKNYFSSLCKSQQIDDDYILNIPVGLFYIYAGDLKGARARLEKGIIKNPDDAKLRGYLGDLHFLRGDVKNSRICYREAFETNPNDVDVDSISDSAVIGLLNHIKKDVPGYLEWVVSYGCIESIFPYKTIKILDDLRIYVNDFIKMEKDYRKGTDEALIPKLFYKCIVLAESSQYLKNIRSVDFIKIRALMKEINPYLFEIYMEGKK